MCAHNSRLFLKLLLLVCEFISIFNIASGSVLLRYDYFALVSDPARRDKRDAKIETRYCIR